MGEAKTNPRTNPAFGQLALVPAARRVSGAGASYVMAPFVHVSPQWTGRFHDGSFGVYYAAEVYETALAEKMFRAAHAFAASGEEPGWFSQYRVLVGDVSEDFHDIRDQAAFEDCLDPNSYVASQGLARSLRASGSNGVVYPSVRDPGGSCLAAFWPDVIGIPVQGPHLALHFDGATIDLVRDETDQTVYRVAH